MKTRLPPTALVVAPVDVEMVYKSLLNYIQGLEAMLVWIDNEEAKTNIREELAEYYQLSLSIYKSHMQHAMCKKAETRPNLASVEAKRKFTPVPQWEDDNNEFDDDENERPGSIRSGMRRYERSRKP